MKTKKPFALIDFGNEAGDDLTPLELMPFFVEQADFRDFLSKTDKIKLATAKKGVGKSALLRWIEGKVPTDVDPEALVIHVKGSDLVRSNFGLNHKLSTPNEYIRDWMIRLASLINRRIGAVLNLAIFDDSITLIESAELDGFRSRNILTSLTDRLTRLLPAKLTKERIHATNDVELLKRFKGKNVWLLVDDLDATYQRTDVENLELSTFFSACRQLASESQGILFRVTMRTDVWPLLRRYDEALDKFEQYHKDITWSQDDFRALLAKRIRHQLALHGVKDSPPPRPLSQEEVDEHQIDMVFAKRMPWGEKERRTYKVIYTLAYHRPRWGIQLCKLAQAEALKEEATLIERGHIDKVWGNYGAKRIADLIAEHKHQCPEVEELLSAFRGAERRMSREVLLTWIKNRVCNHMTPTIEGRSTNQAMQIAHFLFRIGFIVARAELDNETYEHYYFDDMPDFLSGRTNADFNVVWEIHPCYREALDIVKLNRHQSMRRDRAR